jgi:calcium-dependent protein kinase
MFNLLKGVAYMHRKGYMHRDIKPSNILLRSMDDSYDVVLCDFGLATSISEKRKLFSKCGTPGFVAPEVLTYDIHS